MERWTMAQQSPSQPDAAMGRYPLSFTQQYFLSLDEGDLKGAFGNRFTIVSALRIAGHVDIPTLQGALDDVVARHELLRTVVVRDAQPPYQQVCPPCQVPLEVRDWPATGRPRDVIAEELIIEAEKGTMTPRQVPVIRAVFTRFDDRDSVLVVVVHHSASDAWSQNVILHDLAAFYDARANQRVADLPRSSSTGSTRNGRRPAPLTPATRAGTGGRSCAARTCSRCRTTAPGRRSTAGRSPRTTTSSAPRRWRRRPGAPPRRAVPCSWS